MGLLQWLNPIDDIIKSVSDVIDDLHLSGEEAADAHRKLTELQQDYDIKKKNIELQYETELSDRHKYDMQSDDAWSKRIRPYTLTFLLAVVAILSVTDGNIAFDYTNTVEGAEVIQEYAFTIKESYVSLYENLLLLAFGFYFGSRGVEKVVSIMHKYKAGKADAN